MPLIDSARVKAAIRKLAKDNEGEDSAYYIALAELDTEIDEILAEGGSAGPAY